MRIRMLICRIFGHRMVLGRSRAWDGQLFKHRVAEFRCSHCGKTEYFHRIAFVWGAGALEYFYDREYPVGRDEITSKPTRCTTVVGALDEIGIPK